MEILCTENLCKTYGTGENAVRAVDNVDLSVQKGEFVAIVGASGSGKSTLMHLIGGVDRPTSGKVLVDGQDIGAMNADKLAIFRRRQIGIVYQFYNLIPILTAAQRAAYRRQTKLPAERAFRRSAAARQHCACADQPPGAAPLRRADRQP